MNIDTLVRATRRIDDCPAGREDDTIQRGTIGRVQDEVDGMFVVEFEGERVLLVMPDEIRPA